MQIQMPYHRGSRVLEVPDANLAHVLYTEAEKYEAAGSETELVKKALASPIKSQRLATLAKGKKTALVVTSDHTRSMPSKITLPLLLAEIRQENPGIQITILIATGLHRPTTRAEMEHMFGRELLEKETIIAHDAFEAEQMQYLFQLPSGSGFVVNKLAVETELLVLEGFIEPHFFAGFSGGRKSLLPGICGQETVNENHSFKAISHPLAKTGVLDGNPLHIDMIYAAKKMGVDFILNVALDSQKKIIAAFSGDLEAAHEEGCDFVRSLGEVPRVISDIVITTNGGYPLDQNLYQTPKSISTAASCAGDDGVIIIGASLSDGIGGENFGRLMKMGKPAEILAYLQTIEPKKTILEQWCVQIFSQLLLKHTIIVVTEEYDQAELESMNLRVARSFNAALDMALALKGKNASVTVIPDGVAVLIK